MATTKPSHIDLSALDKFCRRHLEGDDHVPTGCMGISRIDLGVIDCNMNLQHIIGVFNDAVTSPLDGLCNCNNNRA
jgi:hypothetical protein